jgi:hypothetical protein
MKINLVESDVISKDFIKVKGAEILASSDRPPCCESTFNSASHRIIVKKNVKLKSKAHTALSKDFFRCMLTIALSTNLGH